jgi:hypothetical protein
LDSWLRLPSISLRPASALDAQARQALAKLPVELVFSDRLVVDPVSAQVAVESSKPPGLTC